MEYHNPRLLIIAPMAFILSLDEGTTSARAVLYDETGCVVSMESRPIACRYPHPGWVEQDATEIWRSQVAAGRRLLEKTGVAPGEIVAAGITNQRETTIVWDRATGKPVAPAIVWHAAVQPISALNSPGRARRGISRPRPDS